MTQPARRIASVLFLLLATALLASPARGGTAARVSAGSPASVRVQPIASRIDWSDGSFSIRIKLSDLDHHGRVGYDDDDDTVPDRFVPSDGLAAFEIVLHFSPAVLRVTHAQAGSFLESTGRSAQCFQRIPRSGQFALGCATTGSAPGPQGSGTLATITLSPVGNGTSFLGLEAQLSGPLGDPIPVAVDGGIVEVSGAPESAPTPEPGGPTDGEGSGPTVLDGGEPGDVTLPEGDLGPGATGGADGSASADGNSSAGGAYPSAGTGYQPPSTTGRPLLLGGALAAAGAALLLIGSRLAARARRP